MTRFATITATGAYIPPNRLTNRDVERRLGAQVHDWLVENVGIEARHVMNDEQCTSDLAIHAARLTLARARLTPSDLDMIILATDTPDQPSPATAARVQHALEAKNAAAFDLNSACAGWVTALDMGAKFIASDDQYRRVLVIGAYGMSRFVDWSDKRTCTLFADGAGAAMLEVRDTPGYLGGCLHTAGEYFDALGVYGGGTARPATAAAVSAGGPPKVEFVRRFPPTFNTERWPALIERVLGGAGLSAGDVDLFVFTQLNLRTIEATMQLLRQPMSKTHWTMNKWGYTGSACIPMTLDDADAAGRIKAGDHVVLCATGGGLSLACNLFRWMR